MSIIFGEMRRAERDDSTGVPRKRCGVLLQLRPSLHGKNMTFCVGAAEPPKP